MRTDPELQPTNTANVFEDFFIVGAAANHFVPFGYEKEDAEVASPKLAPQSLFGRRRASVRYGMDFLKKSELRSNVTQLRRTWARSHACRAAFCTTYSFGVWWQALAP